MDAMNLHAPFRAALLLAGMALLAALAPSAFAEGPANESVEEKLPLEAVDFFESKIRPVLIDHCYQCHSSAADELKAALRLDTREGVLRGGESGDAAVVPGKAKDSPLVQSLHWGGESFQMPPTGKLPDEVIADFERWIEMGAPDPRSSKAEENARAQIFAHRKKHWAFQPPRRFVEEGAAPSPAHIDTLIAARLKSLGMEPSPAADRRTLIRRLYFDLLGLPPTQAEVEAFVNDERPNAYEYLVDSLLARPQFGERWARHWLDVARYADTKGYVFMEERKYEEAYTYRDWVVQAFNRDLPYDAFIKYQLAADQLPPLEGMAAPRDAALGFLTLGRRFLNDKHDIFDDRIDVVTRGTMGLTVSCARCHDHKYDPIPTADYYSLYGVFDSCEEPKDAPTEGEFAGASPLRLVDLPEPRAPRIFIRGNHGNLGPEVPRRFLEILSGPDRQPFERGSGRLELAEAIVSRDNPLTARVMVNRVWLRLFGEGLVATPSDFGVRSDPPSHPDVLDQLAIDFMDQGWSMKGLIKQIVLSHTYRQASDHAGTGAERDPENRLFWRQNRRRLDWESMRDSFLAASGQLDLTQGGAAVDIAAAPYSRRRTLYAFIDRQNLPGMFRAFDFASPDIHSPRRLETSTPQQALYLLNSPFVMEQAAHAVTAVEKPNDAGKDAEGQTAAPSEAEQIRGRIARLYRRILSREPTEREMELGEQFIGGNNDPQATPLVADAWQYGYGKVVEADAKAEVAFSPLPHFVENAWRGGEQMPDAALGWLLWHAGGGHPGNGERAAVRRWVAPAAGKVQVRGELAHPAKEGDGVRGRLISNRHGQLGEWTIHNGRGPTHGDEIAVEAGDTLDFVVECRENESHDSFEWIVSLNVAWTGENESHPAAWNSAENFRGPRQSLGPWQRYAQALMLSNEFQFVD